MFYSHGEATEKISFSTMHWSLTANRSILATNAGQLACMHPSCAVTEEPVLSLKGTGMAAGLGGCHIMGTLQQNKGAHVGSDAGNGIPTQSDKSSGGWLDSFSLGEGVFQAQGPFLYGPEGSKDCMQGPAFPNRMLSPSHIHLLYHHTEENSVSFQEN